MKDKRKILLILKRSKFRDELGHQLAISGFQVYYAFERKKISEIVLKNKLQGIVTQLSLPDMDSIELILNLKEFKINAPIIVISFADSALKMDTLTAGAHTFFQFPVEPTTVIDTIKQIETSSNDRKYDLYMDVSLNA